MSKGFMILSAALIVILSAIMGMLGALFGVCLSGFFWYITVYRGLLFVRAYRYLLAIEEGASSANANEIVKSIKTDSYDLASYAAEALTFSKMNFNGQQLPVIAAARAKGFSA